MTPQKRKKVIKIVLLSLAGLVVAVIGGFFIWALTPAQPMIAALDAYYEDENIVVMNDSRGWTMWRLASSLTLPAAQEGSSSDDTQGANASQGGAGFSSAEGGVLAAIDLGSTLSTTNPTIFGNRVGLIFYPGGRVDARAYAPLMQALAAEGVPAVLVTMPLSLAFFAPNKAQEVIDAYPSIQRWIIAGHSLGGSMAAQFVAGYKQQPASATVSTQSLSVGGLLLLGSWSASDLSHVQNFPVVSISGSRDGLSTREKIQANRANLPPSAEMIEIDGANHAQFGWYGAQSGDMEATISHDEQARRVVQHTLDLVRWIDARLLSTGE